MKRVGICGHYGYQQNLLNGQTIKTKVLTEELINILGRDEVETVDTYGWRSAPVALLRRSFLLIRNCRNIVILPAHKGVKVFVPIFLLFNKYFHRKLHYVVIGGWLPDLLKNDQKLKKKVAKLDGIYAETQLMADQLGRMGLSNVRLFTNFKRLPVVDPEEFVYPAKEPYQLCTFSTVIYEKGIEDAIEAVKAVNEADGEIRYTLDIYGPVAAVYGERFEQIRKTFPDYISYKEAVGSNESVGILKNYFALLFPTRNKTEGVPGTIIDAYAASLPVIASRWNSAEEVVIHNQTGFVYEFMNNKTLVEILRSILEDPQTVLKMKPNCIEMARKFAPEQTIINFTGYLES